MGQERTETSTNAMLETLPEIMDLDSRLTPVSPNHPAGLSKTFLIVGENDEIVKGGHGIAPWNGLGSLAAKRWLCLPICTGR